MIPRWQLPLLFGVAVVAGFVDAIAGGGGLITLPTLLSVGLPPQAALATNKLQSTFGSGSAAWHYARGGIVAPRDCVWGFLLSLAGAVGGAWAVQHLDPLWLKRAIPILLLVAGGVVAARPRLGEEDVHPRMDRTWFEVLCGLGLGFYDGFFGPGTGTFWTLAFMFGLGFSLTRATAYTKVMNFASNAGSLAFFLTAGNMVFSAGLIMGLGQWLGARLGARLVLAKGTRLVRPVFLTAVLAITLKVLWDAWFRG